MAARCSTATVTSASRDITTLMPWPWSSLRRRRAKASVTPFSSSVSFSSAPRSSPPCPASSITTNAGLAVSDCRVGGGGTATAAGKVPTAGGAVPGAADGSAVPATAAGGALCASLGAGTISIALRSAANCASSGTRPSTTSSASPLLSENVIDETSGFSSLRILVLATTASRVKLILSLPGSVLISGL